MYTRPTAPRSIGGVLDDAIGLYRASFGAWLLPSAVGSLLSAAAGVWMVLNVTGRPSPDKIFALFKSPLVWGGYAVLILISLWTYLAVISAIVQVAKGEVPRKEAVFSASLAVLPAALLASIVSGFATMVGLFLLIVPGIFLMGRWLYWAVALVDERGSAIEALERSWKLSQGHWWRGVTIVSIAIIIITVLALVLGVLAGFVIAMAHADTTAAQIGLQFLRAAGNVFILPAAPAAACAVYFDLRLRREGGDLAARVGGLKST